jgi:hypothetical protein
MSSAKMRMRVNDVMSTAKRFLRDQAGHDTVHIESVEANEKDKTWTVVADVGFLSVDLKEVIIDDSDGNVLTYRDRS